MRLAIDGWRTLEPGACERGPWLRRKGLTTSCQSSSLVAAPSSVRLQAREAAWAAESERRIDAFESGALTARDAATVFADLKQRLAK